MREWSIITNNHPIPPFPHSHPFPSISIPILPVLKHTLMRKDQLPNIYQLPMLHWHDCRGLCSLRQRWRLGGYLFASGRRYQENEHEKKTRKLDRNRLETIRNLAWFLGNLIEPLGNLISILRKFHQPPAETLCVGKTWGFAIWSTRVSQFNIF
jgi:hypothetical protein